MTTTQNTELVDVSYPPSDVALKASYERTSVKLSSLDELKKANKEILTKMTDLEIDLSDAGVNLQNIDEALAVLKRCSQLIALRLKMPKLTL